MTDNPTRPPQAVLTPHEYRHRRRDLPDGYSIRWRYLNEEDMWEVLVLSPEGDGVAYPVYEPTWPGALRVIQVFTLNHPTLL